MFAVLDAVRVDVGQAVRRITRSPWLSIVVVLTLALAIAANTTIFSLLKPTVLRKLTATDPDALVGIGAVDAKTNNYSAIHLPVFDALRDQQRVFSSLAAFTSSVVRIDAAGGSFDTGVEGVTPEYFSVLGVRAKAGRTFVAGDHPQAAIAVISSRLAQQLFGSDAAAGRRLVIDAHDVEVVGVTADGFIGARMDGGDDVFVLLPFLRSMQSGDPKAVPRAQALIGRLAAGATIEQARAEVLGRWPAIQQEVSRALPVAQQPLLDAQRLTISSFARGFSSTRDRYGRSLGLVMGLAAALLAVGCVNLSGLMLARALTRRHEFAVRVALGGSRRRLVQQTLIDGVLLSSAAFVLAIPLSWWASALLTSMVSVGKAVPMGRTTPDVGTLLLAALVSLLTGVLIGLLPARRATAGTMDDVLRGRGTAHRIRGASRTVLVTQVALSMILVVGAGLFAATLSRLYANDLQERAHPILFTRLARNLAARNVVLPQSYYERVQEKLRNIPGADQAAFSMFYPAYLGFFDAMPMDAISAADGAIASAVGDFVTPGFFDLYAIAHLKGRDFTWSDHEKAPRVAIVNDTLARKISPGGDVLGRHVRVGNGPAASDVEIVGVVADATVSSIRERHVAALYRPMMQDLRRGINPMAHVRVVGDAASVQRGYVDVVNAEGEHFVRAMLSMDGWLDNAVVEQQLIAGMGGVAAVLAVILASVGLFGLLAYSVSSRTREIGVRLSVGATQGEVMRMIVREGLAVVIPGVVIGIPIALAAAWLLRSQLYGVAPTDPWVISGAAILFILTAAFASWLPALRASRIAPSEALRQD